jgi:hypothetical protein
LLAFGALFVDARAGTTMDFWGSASAQYHAWRFILSRQVDALSLLNALCRFSLASISHFLSRSAPLLPAPSTALSLSMELRSGDQSIDLLC